MIIRTKFLFMFLITAILPLFVLTSVIFNTSQHTIAERTTENILTISSFKESRTHIVLGSYASQARLVSTRPTLLALVNNLHATKSVATKEQVRQYLQGVKQALDGVKSISIVDNENIITASTDESLIGKHGRSDSKTAALLLANNEPASASIKAPLVYNGVQIGTLQSVSQDKQLTTLTKDYTGLGQTGDILFLRWEADGSTSVSGSRFNTDPGAYDKLRNQLSDSQITTAIEKHATTSGIVPNQGNPFFFTLRYMPDFNAAFLVKIDTSEAFQPIGHLRDTILVFSLIFTLLVIMLILFFVHSITGPIANLATVARKTAAGNLTERALILSKDEVGSLAIAFNHMLDELQTSKNTLEQKVRERTQQLEISNKELESFSYSVSHDLRAPLRAIDGYSKILVEDYAAKFDNEGKRVLHTIITSTKQMGNLIDDLLAFSRMGRQEVKKQTVNMGTIAKEVYNELMILNSQRKIDLQIKDLPSADADASLIRQVWANLLSNAIKFTRQRDPAVIEVGATVKPRSTVYYVKDNGAGFKMDYVDKLFGVFQRLHDQKDFEGTGVGLAIIKRIIERHGGKVWAEGAVDKGATIYFELPKTQHNNKERHEKL